MDLELFILIAAPIQIYGEGHFAIGVAKTITATGSFLSMGESVTKCQNRESREECSARASRRNIL